MWLYWHKAFTDEECDELIEMFQDIEPEEAVTFGGPAEGRKTQIRWVHDNEKHAEIHYKMRAFCQAANEQFGLDIDYLPALQYTEYADVGYKYDWHHDINFSRNDGRHRKLSIVLQLTDPDDYEGGEFEFRHIENPNPEEIKARGTVICFVSYHYHCVHPITKGSRNSLVGWYEGPAWR